jgi:hypothetical protein
MENPLRATLASCLALWMLGCHAASPTDELVTGEWVAQRRFQKGDFVDFWTLRLNLRADHTLEWYITSHDRRNPHHITGTWHVAHNNLVVRWELRDDDALIPILGCTGETLILDYPGEQTTFRRQKL